MFSVQLGWSCTRGLELDSRLTSCAAWPLLHLHWRGEPPPAGLRLSLMTSGSWRKTWVPTGTSEPAAQAPGLWLGSLYVRAALPVWCAPLRPHQNPLCLALLRPCGRTPSQVWRGHHSYHPASPILCLLHRFSCQDTAAQGGCLWEDEVYLKCEEKEALARRFHAFSERLQLSLEHLLGRGQAWEGLVVWTVPHTGAPFPSELPVPSIWK